ncbi:uroporphyrinogen-III synthase [Arthrobacter sp. H41]|uniref:uroporphyrinogen-III synthase n=1 Tax=Arthrobacter sp. H41 TaxID=1312978 RepID=UPI0004B40E8B|nr:uroporphyrinogen-III synthase [Arthrobacter sp. H41]
MKAVPLPLAGVCVVLLRSPERSAAMAREVRLFGGQPVVMPLIDFEQVPGSRELEEALARLAEGRYQWVVFTSVTAVASLQLHAGAAGEELTGMLRAGPRIAAAGSVTGEYLASAGVVAHLVPEGSQSARGLLDEMPAGPGAVLLPQADIADPALAEGLTAAGWAVDRVTVYRTVDYPAAAAHRLVVPVPAGDGGIPVPIDSRQFRRLTAGKAPVVAVLTSPSSALRFHAMLEKEAPLGVGAAPLVIAIGPSTATAAAGAGLRVDAVASRPTPEGIAEAAVRAVTGGSTAPRNGVFQ